MIEEFQNNKDHFPRIKSSKNTRTLDIFTRLSQGKIIHKSEEASNFGVDERSIQRDIDDIRAFLALFKWVYCGEESARGVCKKV